jgi:hypothetical protein
MADGRRCDGQTACQLCDIQGLPLNMGQHGPELHYGRSRKTRRKQGQVAFDIGAD